MAKSLEQQARDMLSRVGVEEPQHFTAGDVVELANLIGEVQDYRRTLGGLSDRQGKRFTLDYGAISNNLDEMQQDEPPKKQTINEEDIKRRSPLTGRDLDTQVAAALTKNEVQRIDAFAEKRIREIVLDELKKLVIITKA